MAQFKTCPECEEEFTLTAIECTDCGVPLVYGSIDSGEDDEDSEEFPDISELECVRVGPLPWTRALSNGLTEVGVAHRIEHDTRDEDEGGIDPDRFGGETLYGTWVMPQDLSAAEEIDRALFGHLDTDDADEADEMEVCPACEEALPPDALECPGCGLGFG